MSRAVTENDTMAGTTVFDGQQSRKGYRLNRFCQTLKDPANRERFRADEDGYLAASGLTEQEKRWIRERDWYRLTSDAGGNIYPLLKLAATVGHTLADIGAQCRGETLEEFLATRNAPEAR